MNNIIFKRGLNKDHAFRRLLEWYIATYYILAKSTRKSEKINLYYLNYLKEIVGMMRLVNLSEYRKQKKIRTDLL